ncbi:hypothetical protein D3C73_1263470 [compost metagenome]
MRKFRRINGCPRRKAIQVAISTYTYTANTIARGISTPATASGADSPQRMAVKATSDTSALTAPSAKVTELVTKALTSSSIRWSGLSTGSARNWPR